MSNPIAWAPASFWAQAWRHPGVAAAYAIDRMRRGGSAFQESRKTMPLQRIGKRTGRNEPCSCGSGKKFKRCCQSDAVVIV